MKNTTQATGPATPQQIYLRRAAHSAATYLGYQCQLAQAPEAPVQLLPDGDLPHEALQAPYLRMVFTQPSGMARKAPDLHPSVTVEWAGAFPTCTKGADSSLASYVLGLAREILARMGPGAEGPGGRS